MTVRQLIPDGLAKVSPGPELSRILAGIELSRLSGYDCVEVLKAQYRQVNHERARLMAAMAEVGVCGVVPAGEELRRTAPDEFSADEVRAALVLTRRAADAQFWLAHDLVTRLPAVHAAMDAGVLDEPRARVLSEWTMELDAQHARAVCDQLLPRAAELTTGQLIEQIKKLAIALDPCWAQRRYEQAIAERKVVGYRNPDGSANLSGCNLPVDRVAAASSHIDALAKAAKRAGDSRPIDHIRADLFLGMTDGTYTGMDDADIVTQVLAAGHVDNSRDSGNDHNDSSGDTDPDGGEPTTGLDPDGCVAAAEPQHQPAPAACRPAEMELRVRLSTLLGHDEYPGELAGWGAVHPELARNLATGLGPAQWRFAITDEHGQLVHCGITPARPIGIPTRSAGCRAIVELQVPAEALHALAADPTALGGWVDVVADLAHQLQHDATGQSRDSGDAYRRSPGAVLRRYLEIRDRSRTMIGCRAPAHSADKDHTRDHAQGGLTTGPNLGDACRHDHRLKHKGGWTLRQPQPGHFHWTSRLGHRYQRRPPAIIESLPDLITGGRPLIPLQIPVDTDWKSTQIWEQPPSESEPELPPPPASDPSRDIPPF